MSTTAQASGYLDSPYLTEDYGAGVLAMHTGMQATMLRQAPTGMQAKMIGESTSGMQAKMMGEKTLGMQAKMIGEKTSGMQARMDVARKAAFGMQARMTVARDPASGYLDEPYLGQDYGAGAPTLRAGMQVSMFRQHPLGMQAKMVSEKTLGMQAHMFRQRPLGMQARMSVTLGTAFGMQALAWVRTKDPFGMQAHMYVVDGTPFGMQATSVRRALLGMQATLVIYNNVQLRVLMDFPSRGTAALLGNNWATSSEVAGELDWAPKNLNTDVEEQYYRSEDTVTVATLTCNTGVTQGVPVDTIGIRAHNLTTSAIVQVQGSQNGLFSPPDITFDMTVERDNMYWISPSLPAITGQNKHWRFLIQDPNNPDGHIRIGTIVFGAARIFARNESFNNPLKRGWRHFKDSIKTEGFTNVSNDRALKKFLSLDFEKLDRKLNNFGVVEALITQARTSLKVLVIPTPLFASRYAVFAKLKDLPDLEVESIDEDHEYITVSLDWDESE